MRFPALAALGLGLIATALASPIDVPATTGTNLTTVPFTNETGLFANQTLSVRQLRPPKVDPPEFPPPECKFRHGVFREYYVVNIPKLSNSTTTQEVCKNLWDGLNGHWECTVSSPHGCEKVYRDNGDPRSDVEWWFHTPIFCKKTAVEAAFDWATEKKFGGSLNCIKHPN